VLAAALRHRRLQARVHLRQGLLALARGDAVREPLTLRLLRRAGHIRGDGVPTLAGRAAAAAAARDEARWALARRVFADARVAERYDGLRDIAEALTSDQIAELDRRLGPPAEIRA
jgi:manganese/zinc/iron transport system permease protein